MELSHAICGTIIFAILAGIANSVENPFLGGVLRIVFDIALGGFGLISIILIAKMVWAAI